MDAVSPPAPAPTNPPSDPLYQIIKISAGSGLADGLRVLAWIYLLGSTFAALWWYSNFATIHVPASGGAFSYTPAQTINDPSAGAIAIGVFLQGILVFSISLGVAVALEQLVALRHYLTPAAPEAAQPERQPLDY